MLVGSLDWVRLFLIAAAYDLGAFDDPDRIAELREGHRRAVRLWEALRVEGLVDEATDAWRGPIDVPPELPRTGWGAIADAVLGDRPVGKAEVAERAYLEHLDDAGAEAAAALAARLAPLVTVPGPILELGCGLGTFGAALARASARALVLVDRQSVLDEVRLPDLAPTRHVADLLTDPLPAGAALALLSNVVHLYGAADAQRIVARAAACLAPGGRLVVRDLYVDDERRGPRRGVHFALNMTLYTDGGDVYTAAEMRAWLVTAGLGLGVGGDSWVEAEGDVMVLVGSAPC